MNPNNVEGRKEAYPGLLYTCMEDLLGFIKETLLDKVEQSELYIKAKDLALKIQARHDTIPVRFGGWYDQISRSSQSILLNAVEAHGKGRGYYLSALMIARGEAYETYASLAIAPPGFDDLVPLAKEICLLISKKVEAIL